MMIIQIMIMIIQMMIMIAGATMRAVLLLLVALASCHAAPSIRYHSEIIKMITMMMFMIVTIMMMMIMIVTIMMMMMRMMVIMKL